MEGTSGTPHLLTDVRFSVSRKGYDPDEVDNFLERVSAAVAQLQDKLRQAAAQAESAEVRATEAGRAQAGLQQRIQALEAELAKAGEEAAVAPAPTRNPEEEVEQASKVLVMAQRTADAAIDEATASARTTLADARTQATSLVADAQDEADRLLAHARVEAEAIVTRRRETLAEEVRGLESVRDAVTVDLATLEQHSADQRSALQEAIARLQGVLDDPAAFRVGMAPGLSGASVSDVLTDDTPDDAPATAHGAEGSEEESHEAGPPVVESYEAPPSEEPPAEPTAVAVGGERSSEDAPDEGSADDGGVGTQAVPATVIFDDEATAAVPTTRGASLFAAPVSEVGEEDSPLGPPDDEADAAMRAFFEAEFDDDPGRAGA